MGCLLDGYSSVGSVAAGRVLVGGVNAPKTRGRPFQPGNPGRPWGSRGKATVAAEKLLDGEAKALTRKAIELAKEGDTTALRLCLERIVPPRKDRPVSFAIPSIANANEAASLMSALLVAAVTEAAAHCERMRIELGGGG